MSAAAQSMHRPTPQQIRTVVLASSLGTLCEWYDFYTYGTLAGLFGRLFFPAASATAGFLLALATFGVGFAVRPLGAVVFGALGDISGRKYTFIVTIVLMGGATAGIGFLPTFASIGIAAPILLVLLRVLQGFALGGEYGGAAIYVAEHAPPNRRGHHTSFIQAGAPGGLVLSLLVSVGTIGIIGEPAWEAWGWRIPFLFSLILLGFSLWMRSKLAESPVFEAMKAAGATARNPLKESLDSWPKVRRVAAALLVTAGQAVIAYTALFQIAYLLQNTLHLSAMLSRSIVMIASIVGMMLYILFGWLSDHVGRKRPAVIGCALALSLLFPLHHFIAGQANPALRDTTLRSPVVVSGSDCSFNPFAAKAQATECGRLLDALSKSGVPYSMISVPQGGAPEVTIGGVRVPNADSAALTAQLERAGYSRETVAPSRSQIALIILAVIAMYAFAASVYGPLAAWLVELFPTRVRYTSLSIPYHFGTGYFGGFLPFISSYIVAKTGDPFSGVWYTESVVALALLAALFLLPETAGKELDDTTC